MNQDVFERRMNGSRQAGNEGKMGFYPTSKATVDMEMKLIDFSEIEGTDIILNIADLSAGEGDQLHWMHEYLEKINIKSNAYYNELAEQRYE